MAAAAVEQLQLMEAPLLPSQERMKKKKKKNRSRDNIINTHSLAAVFFF